MGLIYYSSSCVRYCNAMVTSLNISSDGRVLVVFEMVVEEIVWIVFEDVDVGFEYMKYASEYV